VPVLKDLFLGSELGFLVPWLLIHFSFFLDEYAGNQPLASIHSIHNHNPDRNLNLFRLPFRPSTINRIRSDTIRQNAIFSGTPQPVAFPPRTTTIRIAHFSPFLCVEEKIYPVPGGTKRYDPRVESIQALEFAHDSETGHSAAAGVSSPGGRGRVRASVI
jgi:hypothetical protein